MKIERMDPVFYKTYKDQFYLAFPNPNEMTLEHLFIVSNLFSYGPMIVQVHHDKETDEIWLAWRFYSICPTTKRLMIPDHALIPFKTPNNELYHLYQEIRAYL